MGVGLIFFALLLSLKLIIDRKRKIPQEDNHHHPIARSLKAEIEQNREQNIEIPIEVKKENEDKILPSIEKSDGRYFAYCPSGHELNISEIQSGLQELSCKPKNNMEDMIRGFIKEKRYLLERSKLVFINSFNDFIREQEFSKDQAKKILGDYL